MASFYVESFVATVTATSGARAAQIGLVNPAASGKTLTIEGVNIISGQLTIMADRYDTQVSLSVLDASKTPTAYAATPGTSSVALPFTCESHTFTQPSVSVLNHGATIYHNVYAEKFPLPQQIAVPAGKTFILDTPQVFQGTGPTIGFGIWWSEA